MSGGEPGGRRPLVVGLALAAVALAAVLAFGVFGVHTLFVDDEVSEAGPVFDSGADLDAIGGPAIDDPEVDAPTTTAAAPAVRQAARGTFTAVDHPGEGSVVVLTDGTQSFVRFEDDFATDNGPDLYVRVTVGGRAVELEPLKGNVGAQNYELPPDVDPTAIEQVSVWCKRFDSTFTVAEMG